MLTVTLILVVAALIVAILSAMGKAPLWVSVILVAIVLALQVLPLK
jgi:hypothetical protein